MSSLQFLLDVVAMKTAVLATTSRSAGNKISTQRYKMRPIGARENRESCGPADIKRIQSLSDGYLYSDVCHEAFSMSLIPLRGLFLPFLSLLQRGQRGLVYQFKYCPSIERLKLPGFRRIARQILIQNATVSDKYCGAGGIFIRIKLTRHVHNHE